MRTGSMSVSHDAADTIQTQENGHTPIVMVFESHGQDCRYKYLGDTCSTVSAKYGTGGGNAPIVVWYEDDELF